MNDDDHIYKLENFTWNMLTVMEYCFREVLETGSMAAPRANLELVCTKPVHKRLKHPVLVYASFYKSK